MFRKSCTLGQVKAKNMNMKTTKSNRFLKKELDRRLSSNPNYSLRSFARYLDLSPGVLSEILNNKRKISHKTALKISKALGNVEKGHFMGIVNSDLGGGALDGMPTKDLSMDLFQVIADWYHFAILNLSECDNFRWSISWIAKRLGVSLLTAKSAIEKLVKVDLISKKGESYLVNDEWIQSPDGIPSEAIRKYHRDMLNKASEALDFQKIEERDISGVGFAVDPKYLPNMKKEIKEFQDKLLEKYSGGEKSEVYQLEMALFKVSIGEHQ